MNRTILHDRIIMSSQVSVLMTSAIGASESYSSAQALAAS